MSSPPPQASSQFQAPQGAAPPPPPKAPKRDWSKDIAGAKGALGGALASPFRAARWLFGRAWPDLLLLALGALVVARALDHRGSKAANQAAAPVGSTAILPFPAERLSGGADFLSPAMQIDLTALPSAEASASPQHHVGLEVRRVERGATTTVLLEVPVSVAQALQTALANEKARFSYSVRSPGTPAFAPPPRASASADVPKAALAAIDLATSEVQPRPLPLAQPAATRLVVALKAAADAPDAGAPRGATREVVEACVQVIYLDKGGVVQSTFDPAETKHYRVRVPSGRVREITAALAAAERVWLLDDASCAR